jgi:hypothetical protein
MSTMLLFETKKSSTSNDEMDHHYLEEDIITDDEATLEDEDDIISDDEATLKDDIITDDEATLENEDDIITDDETTLKDDIITDDEATLEDEDEEQLHEKAEDEEWLVLSNSEDDSSEQADVALPKNNVAKEYRSKASATTTWLVQHETLAPIDLTHTVVNVVEQVEPSIPVQVLAESKVTAAESEEPKNWAEHFAFKLPKIDFELPKIDFDFGSVKQWVDRKNFKSWLTTKNVQTVILCLLMSLLMKQRHLASQDNEVIQRLHQRLVELQASNEKYASELTLSGLERATWSNMAIRCEYDLSKIQTLHQELEDSIKASKVLAPYPNVAHFQEEYHTLIGNASQLEDISLMPCATSYKAMAIAGSTALTCV